VPRTLIRVVASLAAVASLAGLAACGDDGAEPGASREATLVLDFQPNAVHTGIYAALSEGLYADRGIDLEVREPSASTDAPKLLAAGRADFAILDIHDLGIARERGLDLVGVMPIVQRPLAAVIAGDREVVRTPRDLEGATVGVTGLPSDDAVLDSVLQASGVDPSAVRRVTIGFDSIAALSSGRVDAATAFWNAEGVTLRRLGVPTREFRVDDYGAPRYPELVLCTSREALSADADLVRGVVRGSEGGYREAVDDPDAALDELVSAVDGLDEDEQRAQLDALMGARSFEPVGHFDQQALSEWARWDAGHGIVEKAPRISQAFVLTRR
jgi:putative hydroxymethylpyrimidine transport system substrate-binding protein